MNRTETVETDGVAPNTVSLRLDNVHFSYRTAGISVPAVRGVTLEVAPGEMLAVQGPSGSGKSTLLAIAGGLLGPDSGQVLLGGEDLYQLSERQRCVLRRGKIGYIFQEYNLLRTLTALENITLPLELGGTHRRGASRRGREILERVGLLEQADRYPGQLSGGQQQRVAIARAWAMRPLVLLADEPTGALDQANAELVLDMFAELTDSGISALVITHDPSVACRADRRVRFVDGVVTEELTTEAFLPLEHSSTAREQ